MMKLLNTISLIRKIGLEIINADVKRIEELEDSDYSEKEFDNLMAVINMKDKRIEQLDKVVEYLESFIEFCKCRNPKADCVCENENGWHTSKEYKQQQAISEAREIISCPFYPSGCRGSKCLSCQWLEKNGGEDEK